MQVKSKKGYVLASPRPILYVKNRNKISGGGDNEEIISLIALEIPMERAYSQPKAMSSRMASHGVVTCGMLLVL